MRVEEEEEDDPEMDSSSMTRGGDEEGFMCEEDDVEGSEEGRLELRRGNGIKDRVGRVGT